MGLARIILRCTAWLLAIGLLVPPECAFAFYNCGSHQVVSCEAHDNQHFVLLHEQDLPDTHVGNFIDFGSDELLRNEARHDASHQIEKSKRGLAIVTQACTGIEPLTVDLVLPGQWQNDRVAERTFRQSEPTFLTSIHSHLFLMPSVRLQV